MSGQRELWTRLLLLGREWEKWVWQQHPDISVKLHGWLGMKMPPGFLSLHKWGFFFSRVGMVATACVEMQT